jgi:hypothetical protein
MLSVHSNSAWSCKWCILLNPSHIQSCFPLWYSHCLPISLPAAARCHSVGMCHTKRSILCNEKCLQFQTDELCFAYMSSEICECDLKSKTFRFALICMFIVSILWVIIKFSWIVLSFVKITERGWWSWIMNDCMTTCIVDEFWFSVVLSWFDYYVQVHTQESHKGVGGSMSKLEL